MIIYSILCLFSFAFCKFDNLCFQNFDVNMRIFHYFCFITQKKNNLLMCFFFRFQYRHIVCLLN